MKNIEEPGKIISTPGAKNLGEQNPNRFVSSGQLGYDSVARVRKHLVTEGERKLGKQAT